MSRIGKAPVYFDDKVQVAVSAKNELSVKGSKHTLNILMKPEVTAKVEGKKVVLTRNSESKEARALHGLYRALLQNAVSGVSKVLQNLLSSKALVIGLALQERNWNCL